MGDITITPPVIAAMLGSNNWVTDSWVTANKGPSSQSCGFSSSHVCMWELDSKESWVPKNWCFWTVLLEKTLESPLDCKEIQPVHPKGNQSWIFIGRTDAEAETLIFWPFDGKSWLIRKEPGARKDWRQEEKGMTEDEMVGWHHWLNGHEFEQALGLGMLQSMGSQRVGHYWATELNRQQWFPKRITVLGHFGMAGVTTGLLVESPRFVACSTGLPLIISGLGRPCVVWLSCFSV